MSRLALLILIIGVIHRANATSKDCTYTWVTPTSVAGTGAGTYTRSIGAPLALSMTINDDVENLDTNVWNLDGTALVTLASTTNGAFAATNTENGATATFTAAAGGSTDHTYALSLTAADTQNGKAITVKNTGCNAASAAITLTVTSCNLAAYGDQASATDQTACNNACQREFTCTHDTTEKFTVTCGEDAAWSQKYAPCPCASAGVREVALLALVMLCSSLSATHLI